MRRRRGRRVMTPDGYVWFVRRRRARRRPFWSRRDRDRGERFHGEDELPDEPLPIPGVMDMFTYAEDDLGEYVQSLEESTDTADLPEASGDAIAREFERYLRRRGDEGTQPG